MAEKSIANQTTIAVLPLGEGRDSLLNIFDRPNWNLQFTCTLQETLTALSASPGVIISEVRLPDGHCWHDLLHELQKLEYPPPLIVTDRLADERLWAEVLNLGGHDLLATPFDAREVFHAVCAACRRTENEPEVVRVRKAMISARRGSASGSAVLSAYTGSAALSAGNS